MSALTGRVALVTGASKGIGRAIALRLARDGATVAVHFGLDEPGARDTVDAIERAGGTAFCVPGLLGERGDAAALWDSFDARVSEHTGRTGLDILVNNAGVGLDGHIRDVTEEAFDRVFAVNVRAPFFITQLALDRLRDGGRIVNVSSGVARIAFPSVTAYAMTKGAVETLTRTLALELGGRGITVNCVAPGITRTAMATGLDAPGAAEAAGRLSALGRVGEPADVADAVAFLACDDARFVTGHCLDATGGTLLGFDLR